MNRKMILPILIVIVGVILFIIGLNYEIPRRTFSFTIDKYLIALTLSSVLKKLKNLSKL